MVPISNYLIVAAVLFAIGALGVIIRRNALIVLMSVELMLNAVNLTFVAFSRQLGQTDGHIFVFFVMAIAAAEAAIGLAVIVALFRHRRTVDLEQADTLKG